MSIPRSESTRPSRARWLAAVLGLGILAASFVDGWLVLHDVVLGEGYRNYVLWRNAWDAQGIPFLTAGVIAAGVCGLLAAANVGRRLPLLLRGLAIVAAGLVLASLWPIGIERFAVRLNIGPGWFGLAGAVCAVLLLLAILRSTDASRFAALVSFVIVVAIVPAAAAGRWLWLDAQHGSGAHWSEGSYVLDRDDALRLTIADGTFAIDDRWSGTWESSGWTVMISGDPACPDARGTYHVHDAAEDGVEGVEGIRFVKVVDTCGDGARAADLEAAPWLRDP